MEELVTMIEFLESDIFKGMMKTEETIFLAAIAVTIEEYALHHHLDALEMFDILNTVAKDVNEKLGKYGYEEDK